MRFIAEDYLRLFIFNDIDPGVDIYGNSLYTPRCSIL